MFFWASKILWILFKPLTFIGLLMATGLVLSIWFKRLGHFLIMGGVVLFLAIGFLPIGPSMLNWLETRYAQPTLPPDVDGIIVLGGTFDSYLAARTGQIVVNDNFERMIAFVDLARRYPNARLLFSGGAGNIHEQNRTESVDAKAYLESIGFPLDRVTFEERSRNTFENVMFSKDAVRPQSDQIWVLITSASHMRRAVSIFDKAQWHVIPYPVDPNTPLKEGARSGTMNVLLNFHEFESALREIIGQVAYQLTGKSL